MKLIFVNFMISLFGKYKSELSQTETESTCNRDDNAPFAPMAHQKIVRDYNLPPIINLIINSL